MTDTEISLKVLKTFFLEMNKWEVFAFERFLEKQNDVEHFVSTHQLAKEEMQLIYNRFLTTKPRSRTVRQGLSNPPAYDINSEDIISVFQKSKSRIEIETLKKGAVDLKNIYVFLKENDEWKIDSKKTFWSFKSKWESTII